MADGFLGRWSRRKIAVQEGKPVPEAPTQALAETSVNTQAAPEKIAENSAKTAQTSASSAAPGVWGQPNYQNFGAPAQAPSQPASQPPSQPPEPEPAPTLDDVKSLTPASDFKPFMSAQVSPEVRNAAMKKLFADPHFNIMDGLDIYIDDYSLPDPLPKSMMRQMASAQFLGLFDDENKQAAAQASNQSSNQAATESVAQAPQDSQTPALNDTSSEAEAPARAMLPEPTSNDSPNPAPSGVEATHKNDHA